MQVESSTSEPTTTTPLKRFDPHWAQVTIADLDPDDPRLVDSAGRKMASPTIKAIAMVMVAKWGSLPDPKRARGEVYASRSTIAQKVGVEERTVQRALSVMMRLGWLKRYAAGFAGRRSPTYVILLGRENKRSKAPRSCDVPTEQSRGFGVDSAERRFYRQASTAATAAYEKHLRRRHRVTHYEAPLEHHLRPVVALLADLVKRTGVDLEVLADGAMRGYLNASSMYGDGRLEDCRHPWAWAPKYIGDMERGALAAARDHRRALELAGELAKDSHGVAPSSPRPDEQRGDASGATAAGGRRTGAAQGAPVAAPESPPSSRSGLAPAASVVAALTGCSAGAGMASSAPTEQHDHRRGRSSPPASPSPGVLVDAAGRPLVAA